MREIVRKSSQHCVFFKSADVFLTAQTRININVDGILVPIKASVFTVKLAGRIRLGFVEDNINARSLRIGRKELVSNILRVVEGRAKLVKRNVFTLDNALSASRFAVCGSLILRVEVLCRSPRSVNARRVRQLALFLGKISGRLALHSIGKSHAALAHIVSSTISRVILRNVLTLGVGVDHSPRLRSVCFGSRLKCDAIVSLGSLNLALGSLIHFGCFIGRALCFDLAYSRLACLRRLCDLCSLYLFRGVRNMVVVGRNIRLTCR